MCGGAIISDFEPPPVRTGSRKVTTHDLWDELGFASTLPELFGGWTDFDATLPKLPLHGPTPKPTKIINKGLSLSCHTPLHASLICFCFYLKKKKEFYATILVIPNDLLGLTSNFEISN